MNEINEKEIRKAIQLIKPNGKLFEIRILQKTPKRTISGYFKDADSLINQLQTIDMRGMTAYIVLNMIESACFGRIQSNKFVQSPEVTTTDNDILAYDWLFVDLDPVRPTGVSSSADEMMKARELAKKIYAYLRNIGFNDPLVACSGNGFHLLYRIKLIKTTENTETIQNCLKALDMIFSTDAVKVDTANFNPARLCKLYGTLAQKGTGTQDRPHRMSVIIAEGSNDYTSESYLKKLAGMLPQKEAPQKYNGYNPYKFDIEEWMRSHGLSWTDQKQGDGYTKYILEHCPFDDNHKAPDSCITVGRGGAIGFHCFHDHCQGKTWRDVRIKYEPDAYTYKTDDEHIEAGWREHKKIVSTSQLPREDVEPDLDPEDDKAPVYLTANMILALPDEPQEFIRTGCEGIDYRMKGLRKGAVSLVSGLRGGSKSTWLSQIALQAVTDFHNVTVYSGELTSKNFLRWMMLQAAGKRNAKREAGAGNHYFVDNETKKKIADWLGDHFWLYNNDYGNNFETIAIRLKRQIQERGAELIILDNLMTLDISGMSKNEKWDAQKNFALVLHQIAQETMTHIIFVAHPRKVNGFLRLQDVAGSSDLVNVVDNAFIIHRNNEDFKKLSKETFKWKDDHDAYKGTNVIEIAKDREDGNIDVFIPLWYEPESKRLNNRQADSVKYGWEPDFTDSIDEEIPFD